MTNCVIPPCPAWFSSSVLACAPDDTLIYGSYSSLVVIRKHTDTDSNDVKVYPLNLRIISVKCSPNWSETVQEVAVFSEDGNVFIWDVLAGVQKHCLDHTTEIHDRFVDGDYAGVDKVIAAFEKGIIAVWRYNAKEVLYLREIFAPKEVVTCMQICPHVSYLAAFGLKTGYVTVVDLRNKGRILHKFKGHYSTVSALSWCPTVYNVFQANKKNNQEAKNLSILESTETSKPNQAQVTIEISTVEDVDKDLQKLSIDGDVEQENATEDAEIKNDSDKENVEVSAAPPVKDYVIKKGKPNPWVNLKYVDDDEPKTSAIEDAVEEPKEEPAAPLDFNDECRRLLEQIKQRKQNDTKENGVETEVNAETGEERKILKAVRKDAALEVEKSEKNDSVENSEKMETVEETEKKETGEEIEKKESVEETEKKETGEEIEKKESVEETEQSETIEETEQKETANKIKKKETVETTEKKEVTLKVDKDFLLASIDRDGMVCIWKTSNRGRLEKKLNPNVKFMKRRNEKCLQVLHWISPFFIFSSHHGQKLLSWDLSLSSLTFKLLQRDHTDQVFALASKKTLYSTPEVDSWTLADNAYIWSFAKDKYLFKTSLGKTRDVLMSIPTIASKVSSFVSSPIDPCRLAICTRALRLWDITNPVKKTLTLPQIWVKGLESFTALAWHPEKEVLLAVGTQYGRVGIVNVGSTMPLVKLPEISSTEIFRLEFGPIPDCTYGLYALSEGNLVYYNVQKPKADPVVFPFNREESISNFSWKPDYSLVAVGTKQGSVSLFTNTLQHLTTIYGQSKIVTHITWHPLATSSDESGLSKESTKFATLCSTDIMIYDTSAMSLDSPDQASDVITVKKVETPHSKLIRDICWSPHESGLLATAGEDGFVLVYNTAEEKFISTCYEQNIRPACAVVWNPLEPNVLIASFTSEVIQMYNYEQHPALTVEELTELGKKRYEYVSKVKQQTIKDVKKEQGGSGDKKNSVNLLPNISNLQNKSCLEYFTDNSNSTGEKSVEILKQFFGTKDDVLRIVEDEKNKHLLQGRHSAGQILSLWTGDIGERIKNAMTQNSLTPWLVSMAPMVSQKLWQECCEAYAKQLAESESADARDICAYYLACHKVEEAVSILLIAKMFREASALAKIRLAEDEPLHNVILEKWAKFEENTGRFELAAQIYEARKSYSEAARCLSKRTPKSDEENISLLKISLKLAQKGDNPSLESSLQAKFDEVQKLEIPELPTRKDLFLADVKSETENPQENET